MQDVVQTFVEVVQWIRSHGLATLPLAYLAFVLANAALVPASLLTITLGFVYGFWPGLLTASLARPSAAALACFLARKVVREHVQAWADRRPVLLAVDRALSQGGVRIVALLRLSPVISSTLVNWLLGVTRVSFRDMVLGSALGVIPGTLAYSYVGSGLEAARQIVATRPAMPYERELFWLGMVATIVCVVVVSRLARRELLRAMAQA